MTRTDILRRFQAFIVWERRGERAPHKPLLILYAIGKLLLGEEQLRYAAIEANLRDLLKEFGPWRENYRPQDPFWRLKNARNTEDRIWEIPNAHKIEERTRKNGKSTGDVRRIEDLREHGVGGFLPPIADQLRSDIGLRFEVVGRLLSSHFPVTYHADILQAVGIEWAFGWAFGVPLQPQVPGSQQKSRDPRFRPEVLEAYRHRCAICGFNVTLGDRLIAIEAAHIKWHSADGPTHPEMGWHSVHYTTNSLIVGYLPCQINSLSRYRNRRTQHRPALKNGWDVLRGETSISHRSRIFRTQPTFAGIPNRCLKGNRQQQDTVKRCDSRIPHVFASHIINGASLSMELKEHIDDIRNRLEQKLFPNETAVRQGIVDRLLNALGWRTFDTQRVFPEYPIDGGRVDYALCHPPGKPIVFIEVKRVGNIDGAEKQLFEYAFHEGVPILILTDGQKWRFFHPAGSGSYQERLVRELDLITDGSEESSECLFKYLMYAAVQAGIAGQVIAEDYQEISQQREVHRNLPEAWENLLSGKSEDSEFLIEAVKSETQRLCGNRPTNEQVFSFLKGAEREIGRMIIEDPPPPPALRPKSRSHRGEKYTSYFQALLDELREQHKFTNARHPTKGSNYYSFTSGTTGIRYLAGFNSNGQVYTKLRINFRDYEKNKNFFDVLKKRESEINAKFGSSLTWERCDDILGCKISLEHEGNIESDARALESIRAWHVQNLLKFKEVFTPEIQRALDGLKSSEMESE